MKSTVLGFRIATVLTFMLTTTLVFAQEVTLEQVQAALPGLEQFAQETLEKTGVPGVAIAVVYQGEVVYLKGFGVREVGKDEPITKDTVFQLASMSKPISSTVIAALVSDGVVSWDDRLIDLNPTFRLSDPWITNHVTLRDMFSHRSGLYANAGNDLEALGFERDEILARLRYLKPAGEFRATYAYSNFGMTAGGVAAAKAAGKTWEEVAEEQLYEPLGMSSTSSRYEDFVAEENRAALHIPVDDEWTAKLIRDADPQSPAGGVSSTVRDLAQWVRLQLGNGSYEGEQIISEEALAQTHQPIIFRGANPITGMPTFYGLGWGVDYDDAGRLRLGHAGAFSVGARTVVTLIPSEDLGIIVLANAFPTGVPEAISAVFLDLVLEGEPTRDWLEIWNGLYDSVAGSFAAAAVAYAEPPAQPSPALPLSAYVGSYTNDYVGDIEVTKENGVLTLHLGPQQQAFALTHYDRDLFLSFPDPEWPEVPSGVTFSIGPDGQATRLVIDNLNGNGQGAFTRTPEAQ